MDKDNKDTRSDDEIIATKFVKRSDKNVSMKATSDLQERRLQAQMARRKVFVSSEKFSSIFDSMTQEEKKARFAEKAKRGIEFLSCSGNLPELSGSEKQISWATELRNKFIVAATEAAQSAIGNDPIESKDMADFAGYIVLKRSASDWIDSISKEFAVLKYSEMSKCIEWRRNNKEWYNR